MAMHIARGLSEAIRKAACFTVMASVLICQTRSSSQFVSDG